jgi:hypothetical protein
VRDAVRRGKRLCRSLTKWDELLLRSIGGTPRVNKIPSLGRLELHSESGSLMTTHSHLSSRHLICRCMSMKFSPSFSFGNVIVFQDIRQ